MNEELNKAFDQISDRHINEAAAFERKQFPWVRSVALLLAVVLAWTAIWAALDFPPTVITPRPTIVATGPVTRPAHSGIQSPGVLQLTNLVAAPAYPEMTPCPVYSEYADYNEYNRALNVWHQSKREQYDQPAGYADCLSDFWANSIPEFLSGEGNRAYSPVNVYLALAMLAEVTDGDTRQEVLDLLGADSIDALRTQAGHVWNAHYSDDGKTTSLLANSLWLDDAFSFKNDTVQTLADSYYASVFHGDLGTEPMNEQLRSWINAQTGGLLEDQTQNTELSEESVFALVSTLYFATDWDIGFQKDRTANATFHCEDWDMVIPFMNRTIAMGTYYWGEDFGAVCLPLSTGGMWLILPDEGKTVEDVLASGEYLEMTQSPADWKNKKSLEINLSMPKFDISTQSDLIEGMKNLGLSRVFDADRSDYTPMTDTEKMYLDKIDHAVRVSVDEEGVAAAAYTVMDFLCGAAPMVPTNEIDFVLDRPFLFVVSSRNALPLFAGVLEQP